MNAGDMGPKMTWDIYKHLSDECHHFNQLEGNYRTLASTWLLAAFAGQGYVLKELDPTTSPALITMISVAAAVGLFLLWMMDLMVYHRLLGAAFARQRALEMAHPWLPQVAGGMWTGQRSKGVLPRIVWFYILPYLLFACIGCITFAVGVTSDWQPVPRLAATALVAGVAVGVAIYMYAAGTARTEEHVTFAAAPAVPAEGEQNG